MSFPHALLRPYLTEAAAHRMKTNGAIRLELVVALIAQKGLLQPSSVAGHDQDDDCINILEILATPVMKRSSHD